MRTFSLVLLGLAVGAALLSRSPVSYTHLDVYKRQRRSSRRRSPNGKRTP